MQELYSGSKGDIKWCALLSTFLGIAPSLPGFAITLIGNNIHSNSLWEDLYHGGSWIIALAISGTAHVLLRWLGSFLGTSTTRGHEEKSDASTESCSSA